MEKKVLLFLDLSGGVRDEYSWRKWFKVRDSGKSPEHAASLSPWTMCAAAAVGPFSPSCIVRGRRSVRSFSVLASIDWRQLQLDYPRESSRHSEGTPEIGVKLEIFRSFEFEYQTICRYLLWRVWHES